MCLDCSTGTDPATVSVSVRRHDLGRSAAVEGGFDRDVAEIIIHPDYQRLTYNRDVALWKLSEPITDVEVIPLDTTGRFDAAGNVATVIGWGTTSEGGSVTDVLREVEVPLMTNEDCDDDYPGEIYDEMLCAGYPLGGKDACQGDSGGPLFYEGVQVGVVSWGYGCARPGSAGVYARVSALADWIVETINSN